MKNWNIITLIFISLLLFLFTGCGAEFTGGVATGVAIEKMVDKAEDDLLIAIDEYNTITADINAKTNAIEGTVLIQPKTLEAIKNLKGREKDPVTWIALASILANVFGVGRVTKRGLPVVNNAPPMPTVKDPL
jgi:hypothetical protein